MFQGIRAVVFDAVGTLVHPHPPAADVYAAFGRQFGSRLDVTTIRERFHEAFRHEEDADRALGWRTDASREERRWQAIVAQTLPDIADVDQCFQLLWNYFAEPTSWRAAEDVGRALGRIQAHKLALGVASNFDGRLHSVLAGIPALPRDLAVLVSAEISWRKPAPEFFAAIGERLGVSPNEILMVGDDAKNDVAAARAAGLQALLFRPQQRLCDLADLICRDSA